MKNLKRIVMVLFISLFMFSCGGGSGSPKGVAQSFMEAISKQDFKTAKELGTDKTKAFIGMIEGLMAMMPEDKKKEAFGEVDAIEWGEVKVDGDKAKVYFSEKGKEKNKKDKIDLVKVDGKWKVDMKKNL
jgi:PBP1b-binding outer membrane lipoprotein LpoB